MPLLTLSWLVPLAGAVLLLLIGNADERRSGLIRWLALAISLVAFAVTIAVWLAFDSSSSEFQLVERAAHVSSDSEGGAEIRPPG